VRRIVVLGRGAAGKSVLAARLGEITGLAVIELDQLFWRPGLVATPHAEWASLQRDLARRESWIMDGDLGPYDELADRLAAADTVIVLDFSPPRCLWRALRRSRERADFWRWVAGHRRRSLPLLRRQIAAHAGHADVRMLTTPRAVSKFLAQVERGQR
jgi:adenylate kinase family enzyme